MIDLPQSAGPRLGISASLSRPSRFWSLLPVPQGAVRVVGWRSPATRGVRSLALSRLDASTLVQIIATSGVNSLGTLLLGYDPPLTDHLGRPGPACDRLGASAIK